MTEIKETGNRKWAFSDQKSQKEANFVFMADLFHSFTENLKVKLEVIVIMFFPFKEFFQCHNLSYTYSYLFDSCYSD